MDYFDISLNWGTNLADSCKFKYKVDDSLLKVWMLL